MTIRSFDLLQPRSLYEASELLLKHRDEARPIAGGTTLVILMKQRAVHYPYLVDLQSIPGLNQIAEEADGIRIGALVTHRAVELSPCAELVSGCRPSLQHDRQRAGERASVGAIGHADYRLDPPPALLLLKSEVTLFGPRGSRGDPIKGFFTGMYETVLEPGEILVDVKVPTCRRRAKPFICVTAHCPPMIGLVSASPRLLLRQMVAEGTATCIEWYGGNAGAR